MFNGCAIYQLSSEWRGDDNPRLCYFSCSICFPWKVFIIMILVHIIFKNIVGYISNYHCMSVSVYIRGWLRVSFSITLCVIFESLSLNSGLTNFSRLARQWPPTILFSLSPQHWGYRSTTIRPSVYTDPLQETVSMTQLTGKIKLV